MRKSHFITIFISTVLSISGFYLLENRSASTAKVTPPQTASATKDPKNRDLDSLRAITHSSGEVRIIADGLKAPGKNPYYDPIGTLHWERASQPFQVVQKKGDFSWTAEDGMKDEIMQQLANNNDMLEAMQHENPTLNRRQLIYFDEKSFHQKRNDILDGKLTELTLPGFNGEEIKIRITHAKRLEGDAELRDAGYFGGSVTGDANSHIMVGTSNDGYSIQLDSNGKSYKYDIREKGEFILSDINTEKALAVEEPCRVGDGAHVGKIIPAGETP